MTTKAELDKAKRILREQEDQEKLDIEFQKVQERLHSLKKSKPPDDIGGQMKYILNQHGLRTTFYCFIFAMTIFLVGALTPYYLVPSQFLAFFTLGPVLFGLYGVYSIPWVKEFFNDFFNEEVRRKVSKK